MSEEISVGRISKDLDKARILMAFFGSEDQPCRHLKLGQYQQEMPGRCLMHTNSRHAKDRHGLL